MILKRLVILAVMLLFPALAVCQETFTVPGVAHFQWPTGSASAFLANNTATSRIVTFINSLRSRVSGYGPTQCTTFRFARLERAKFYLVASCGGRIESDLDVVGPGERGFHFTEVESNSTLPLPMSIVDLDGDGVDELVTGTWPAGYMGASTPPIYWYTVWKFLNGKIEDASSRFPVFYRTFVLEQPAYVGNLLSRLQAADPKGTLVPLAEIRYIHLRFERTILGKKDAGLDQALVWARSRQVSLQVLGMSSLAEIPSQTAEEELLKLSKAPSTHDLAAAFLTKRERLLGRSK
jgi:hypothetical protein